MNQKRTFFVAISLCLFLVMTSADILKKAGKAGNTGSPTENNCNQCHTGNALNSGGLMTITSDIPNNQYTPGQVYNMTATVSKEGMPIFGIGVEALKSSNTNGGTLSITNAAETQILSAANTRINVVHKLNGGLQTGTKSFAFRWTAPVAGTGNITFYGAGVAGNNSNSNAGDFVYTTTLAVTEAIANAIAPAFEPENIRIYPNPANDWLNVATDLKDIQTISIMDINGKIVATSDANAMTTMYVKSLESGLYFIQAVNKDGNVVAVQKFVKN